jgi:DEAD/DEAH box helicase domain-containing protein
MSIFTALINAINNGKYTVAEKFEIPPSEAAFSEVPTFLFQSRVGDYLKKSQSLNVGLWRHQAEALAEIGTGKNVVISTGTSSGKSLIFRAAAFHEIITSRNSRVVVFYPLKALASDQMRDWKAMAKALGLDSSIVGRIDGSIAYGERDEIIGDARIIIMTPDICHAWMMSRLAIPKIKEFIANISYIVMDEAHTFDGVFGSNFAFLMRRLLAARKYLLKQNFEPVRVIASTATILDPAKHMELLVGMGFTSITEESEGVPREERICTHVIAPPGEEMRIAKELQTDILNNSKYGGFITFVDSRKGVEVLAHSSQTAVEDLLGDKAVMPYRSGYDSQDRENIERRLQSGELRGVVSTSALELGINLPHLAVGINIGVPPSRKAYRQRLGRIGRSGSKGAFVVVATKAAFSGYGTWFRQYHDLSVEPSYLYLNSNYSPLPS